MVDFIDKSHSLCQWREMFLHIAWQTVFLMCSYSLTFDIGFLFWILILGESWMDLYLSPNAFSFYSGLLYH
jgi:hypothetical protein